MTSGDPELQCGLAVMRRAVRRALEPLSGLAFPALACPATAGPDGVGHVRLLSGAISYGKTGSASSADSSAARSSESDDAEASRLIGLVELARAGDCEAFGQLYDHYNAQVYRFVYYRVRSVPLAEDLLPETFLRALRSISSFRWQGKDFGAWLMTIARNLIADHYKSGRTRLESTTEDMGVYDSPTEGPEESVVASLTNERLLIALCDLPVEQQECLILRFLQGLSIAETASILGRSDGAVKQLQLRGVRNLARHFSKGMS